MQNKTDAIPLTGYGITIFHVQKEVLFYLMQIFLYIFIPDRYLTYQPGFPSADKLTVCIHGIIKKITNVHFLCCCPKNSIHNPTCILFYSLIRLPSPA